MTITNYEGILINNLQKIIKNDKLLSKILIVISAIFYLKYFILLLLFLFVFKKLSKRQIIIIIIGIIIVNIIKKIFKRERPFTSFNNILKLDPYNLDRYSFPSGHMTTAFLLAYYLNKNMNTSIYYILPILVAISRISLGVHYPTDIIGGFILAKLIIYIIKD